MYLQSNYPFLPTETFFFFLTKALLSHFMKSMKAEVVTDAKETFQTGREQKMYGSANKALQCPQKQTHKSCLQKWEGGKRLHVHIHVCGVFKGGWVPSRASPWGDHFSNLVQKKH